jgi:SNF2 family DNA or RNA helicase
MKKRKTSCDDHLLVVDEAHNLKTVPQLKKGKGGKVVQTGVYTKYITRCARKAFKVLLLSATPVQNDPKDLIPLYNMIREHTEPEIVRGRVAQADVGRKVSYTANELLRCMTCKVSYYDAVDRRMFPETREKDVYLKMTPSYQEKYQNLLEGSDVSLKHFGETDLSAFHNGFRRATNILEDEKSPKIKWVLNRITAATAQPAHKMIIFSHFLDAGNLALFNRLTPQQRRRAAYIRGSVSKTERARIVHAYNTDTLQFLFISKAGGEGLDLKGTREIILFEPSWNLAAEEQVIGRGVRYLSHDALPLAQRRVDVYRLYLIMDHDEQFIKTKPTPQQLIEMKSQLNPLTHSVDLIMKYIKIAKEHSIEPFKTELIRGSIENMSCP